jgi:hypothetical protein
VEAGTAFLLKLLEEMAALAVGRAVLIPALSCLAAQETHQVPAHLKEAMAV